MQIDTQNCRARHLRSSGLIRLAQHLLKLGDQALQTRCGLTHAQLQVLMVVECTDQISQMYLAQALDLTQAAVSRLTETLVTKGLLDRVENPSNRRENLVSLTPAGRTKIETAYQIIEQLETQFYSDIADKTLESWQTVTSQLLNKLQRVAGPDHSHRL